MYEYRKLSPEQRCTVVKQRLACGYPPHSPPHPVRDQPFYLLTAASYEHVCLMPSRNRRRELLDALFESFITDGIEIRAWIVVPNHYHLLVQVDDFDALKGIFRLVHGRTAYRWNLEDSAPGRKVWCSYTDRAIRSERHYYTTLNYIHFNPVKHGWTKAPYEWTEGSVSWYLEHHGREWLRDLWVRYPVRDYGRDWDP